MLVLYESVKYLAKAMLFLANKWRKTPKSLNSCVAWLKCTCFANANNRISSRQAGWKTPYERTEISSPLGETSRQAGSYEQALRALLQTQFPRIGNGFSNSLNIHDVEGIGPIVLFIKKMLSTYNYQNICIGGRTHNFIHLHMCSRRNVLPKNWAKRNLQNV